MQKTAIDPDVTVHGKIAIEMSNDHKVLDRLTANGKQSENASGEVGHENHPTVSGPNDPSLLLQPKLGKPGRIAKGSRPPKTLSTHHLAGHAVMRGESRPRTGQSRQQVSAANERLLEPPLPKELRRQKSQRSQDERPEGQVLYANILSLYL